MVKPGRLVLVAAALVLAGCTPTSVATDTYSGGPPGFDGSGGLLNGKPTALWIAGKARFAIVTFGSSSCPPVPTSLSATPPSTISITFVPSAENVCTDDLSPTTHEFRTPAEIDRNAPVDVAVRLDFDTRYDYDLVLE